MIGLLILDMSTALLGAAVGAGPKEILRAEAILKEKIDFKARCCHPNQENF